MADVLKFVPVIVTVVPMGPEDGEKEVIVGASVVGIVPHKYTASISPSKKIRVGDCKRRDNSVRQAGSRCSPAVPLFVERKDSIAISSGKEINAGYDKRPYIMVCQRRSPACTVVGGKKDAARSSAKRFVPETDKNIDPIIR